MKIPDLTDEEKKLVKQLCGLFPTYLKTYWKTDELPSFKAIQERTARQFLRYKRCGYTLDQFYTKCETFLPELVLYASNPGRIQSVCKRLRILRHFGVKRMVDFGSGVGTDSFIYAHFGIKTTQVEYKNPSRAFARWLFKFVRMENHTKFVEPATFVSRLVNKNKEYDAIQAIEVVAHVESPYYLFSTFMRHAKVVMWTNDIGLHRDEHKDPQHLPHSLKKVIGSLDKHGEKFKIEGMAIPPRVWVRR